MTKPLEASDHDEHRPSPSQRQGDEPSRRPRLPTDVYLPVRLTASRGPAKANSKAKSKTKQDAVLAMLRRSNGATVAAIMKATGWQQHSVRGFVAGVVRKKLRLPLTTELRANGERAYRIKKRRAGHVGGCLHHREEY